MGKILFCNVAWMKEYQGIKEGYDEPKGAGSGGKGRKKYEVYNFDPIGDSYYGYVHTSGQWKISDGQETPPQININNLGASDKHESIDDGITVVWTAPFQGKGERVIIGWYQNATVFRERQEHSLDESRKEYNKFYIKASVDDSELLDEHDRTFKIPRAPKRKEISKDEKGGMGRNVWYAEDLIWYPDGKREDLNSFIERVRAKIKKHTSFSVVKPRRGGAQDQDRKAEVERAAINKCWSHFKAQEYTLKTVEKDNVGWDIEATKPGVTLRIEVKGLSGSNPSVGLTPNEYDKFKKCKSDYRLAVVINALKDPELFICYYDGKRWLVEGKKCTLSIERKIGASIELKCK